MNDNNKSVNSLIPDYYSDFTCIGGSCEDNCCIGWDVEIDKKTYKKYKSIENKAIAHLIKQKIFVNDNCFDENIDYAMVELSKNNRCPFLNDKNLCIIQANYSHSYLSNVCATYPRFMNKVNGTLECSINISCPEAAKLILLKKFPIKFIPSKFNANDPKIINFEINTANNNNVMVSNFIEIRYFTIEILQNRNHSIAERLIILSAFFKELDQLKPSFFENKKTPNEKSKNIVAELLSKYKNETLIASTIVKEFCKEEVLSEKEFKKLLFDIFDNSKIISEIDSKKYLSYIKKLKPENTKLYFSKLNSHSQKSCWESYPYIIENYLVNYVFGSLFPAAESEKPFETYMMLLIKYLIITSHLEMMWLEHKSLSEDDCVNFIQSFSKAIEHHHTYMPKLIKLLKQNNYFSIEFAIKALNL